MVVVDIVGAYLAPGDRHNQYRDSHYKDKTEIS